MSDLRIGDAVTVLLDPRNPSYSELPGHPGEGKHGWVVVLILSVITAIPLLMTVSFLLLGWPKPKPRPGDG